MPTLVALGGFLGSGKTTTLLSLARRLTATGQKVAVITNDQGSELVDTALAETVVGDVSEVTGGCFCCRFEDLAEVVTARLRDGVDTVLAEAVGSCTDLSATVVRPLRHRFGDALTVAPLAALVDPDRYRLFARAWDVGAESDLAYLYRHQLAEADIIAVNKTDLVPGDRLPVLLADLGRRFGQAGLVTCAAADDRVADLARALGLDGATPAPGAGRSAELDYDRYAAAEASLAWLNRVFEVEGPGFGPAAWIGAALEHLSAECAQAGILVGHAKAAATTAEGLAKASLTGAGDAVRLDAAGPVTATRARVVLNLRVAWSPEDLDRVVAQAAAAADRTCETRATAAGGGEAFRPAYPRPTYRM